MIRSLIIIVKYIICEYLEFNLYLYDMYICGVQSMYGLCTQTVQTDRDHTCDIFRSSASQLRPVYINMSCDESKIFP